MALVSGDDGCRTRSSFRSVYLSQPRPRTPAVIAATTSSGFTSRSNTKATCDNDTSSGYINISRIDIARLPPHHQPPPHQPLLGPAMEPLGAKKTSIPLRPLHLPHEHDMPLGFPFGTLTSELLHPDFDELPIPPRLLSRSALLKLKRPIPKQPRPPLPFLHPLPKVTQLTPRTLLDLSTMMNSLPTNPLMLIFPCTPAQLSTLLDRFHQLLDKKEYFSLWEYNASREEFIVKCMPSPIHENFMKEGTWQLVRGIDNLVGRQRGISVVANTQLRTKDPATNKFGRRIPDLAIEVLPYTSPSASEPDAPTDADNSEQEDHEGAEEAEGENLKRFIYSIIFEVGFTQSLTSLEDRARLWLDSDNATRGTHLAVLIHINQQPQSYTNPDTGQVLSTSKVQALKFAWPTPWFEGRGIWEEVCLRREKEKKSRGYANEGESDLVKRIKKELKAEIAETLVKEDRMVKGKPRRVIPALVEPLDAAVYVYRRKPGEEGGKGEMDGRDGVDGDAEEEAEAAVTEVVEEVEEVVEEVVAEELEGWFEDRKGFSLGEDYFKTELYDSEYNSEEDDTSISSMPSLTDASNTTTTTSAQSTSSETNIPEGTASLELIYTHPLLSSSRPVPDLSTQRLQFSIAELYGPLPTPTQLLSDDDDDDKNPVPEAVLASMPPHIRPHANKRIVFPLEDVAKALLDNKVGMKEWRAEDRARGIVKRAWREVKLGLKEEKEPGRQDREAGRQRERGDGDGDGDGDGEGDGDGNARGRKRRKDKHGRERTERWLRRVRSKIDADGIAE